MSENFAYLIAGGPGKSKEETEKLFGTAITQCAKQSGTKIPSIVYIGTANNDNETFFESIKSILISCGAGKVDMVSLSKPNPDIKSVKNKLHAADGIFISGGEVDDGMARLEACGITDFLKELFKNGKFFFGVSAGSIMMGEHWAHWENEDDDSTATLIDCLSFIPTTFDTHAENENWHELKTVLRLLGEGAFGYGIKSGSMIVADKDGVKEYTQKPLRYFIKDGKLKAQE